MTWIEGTAKKTFEIHAPIERVYEFFITPALIAQGFDDLERKEFVDESTTRWVYKKRKQKGITFQPECTVRYSGNGKDQIQWEPAGPGTMRCSGSARLRAKGPDLTEVEYHERTETDLPIPSLLAKAIRPLVAKELQHGVFAYLNRARALLEK
jgi:uncharacterized membrane protein